jgi:hypothetical protein
MSSGPKTVQSSGTSGQSSTLNPNQAAMPMLGWLGAQGNALMDQPVGFFPGQTYVGPSDLTQQGVDMAAQAGQGMNMGGQMQQIGALAGYGALPGMNQVNQQAMGNLGFLSNAADVANNPYAQNILAQNQATANQSLAQMMPSVNQGAQSVNAMGSSRHGLAQGQAVADTTRNLLNTNAQMMGSMYGQGLGAQQNALGQTGAMLGNLGMPSQFMQGLGQSYGQGAALQGQGAGMLGQAGQTVEGYQQKALDDAMQRYAYQFQEPWTRMQNIGGLANYFQPYGTQVSSGSSNSTQPNPNYKSPLQTAMGIGSMAAGFFSDRRLKKNIVKIGTTGSGVNIYRYDYLWGQPAVGVMADEVPADWVIKHESGFDMVDYSKVR